MDPPRPYLDTGFHLKEFSQPADLDNSSNHSQSAFRQFFEFGRYRAIGLEALIRTTLRPDS
jgi:hypothetical protein